MVKENYLSEFLSASSSVVFNRNTFMTLVCLIYCYTRHAHLCNLNLNKENKIIKNKYIINNAHTIPLQIVQNMLNSLL